MACENLAFFINTLQLKKQCSSINAVTQFWTIFLPPFPLTHTQTKRKRILVHTYDSQSVIRLPFIPVVLSLFAPRTTKIGKKSEVPLKCQWVLLVDPWIYVKEVWMGTIIHFRKLFVSPRPVIPNLGAAKFWITAFLLMLYYIRYRKIHYINRHWQ